MYNPTNQNYDAVYRNTGNAQRRLNRVEDAYPMHRYKSEWEDAKEFFSGLLTGLFFLVLIGFVVYSIYNFFI
jgi:hypothetical protein